MSTVTTSVSIPGAKALPKPFTPSIYSAQPRRLSEPNPFARSETSICPVIIIVGIGLFAAFSGTGAAEVEPTAAKNSGFVMAKPCVAFEPADWPVP
jgi:hypothetical protein